MRRWPPVPEVSSALQRRRPRIRAHRATTLTRAEVTVREGIPVTTPARTLADIAPRLTDRQLTRAIHESRRNGALPDPALGACARDALALELGFATLRVTWRRLHREPERLAHQLRSILTDRERRGGPPPDTV